MAVTRAPLLSFGASGQIGKTQVYSNWRGVPYARQLVKPSNPNSADQVKTRNVFRDLTQIWKLSPAIVQLPWTANAAGRPFTNRNKFLSVNIPLLRTAADFSAFVGSPGAKGGPAAQEVSVTGGAGSLTIDITPPALPTGWTINNSVAWAVKNGDPQDTTAFVSYAGTADADPWTVDLTGLPAGEYQVTAWFEYQVNPTTKAYGPSISATGTAT